MFILCFLCLLVQIGLGIQIRESVDWVIKTSEQVDRTNLIQLVPWIFYVHRSFSWVIFSLALIILYKIYKNTNPTDCYKSKNRLFFVKFSKALRVNSLFKYSFLFFILVCSQMFIGGALNHLDFPIFAQPVHLLAANLLFGLLCFYMPCCFIVLGYIFFDLYISFSCSLAEASPARVYLSSR